MKKIYLDYAAATPLDQEVLQAMMPYFTDVFYNPSATYLASVEAKRSLNQARAEVAKILGAKPPEIIFTAGATEANNLAIKGVMNQFPDAEVLVSSIEHDSVLAPAEMFNCQQIPADKHGRVDLQKLEKLISDKTVLVSVMMVNNELGSIQPVKEIANLLQQIRNYRKEKNHKLPLYLHTDAAQAANYFDLHVSRLGVDMMSLNGGKIYGPKQSGVLFIKAGITLRPLIVGGGQEFGLRSGTENLASAIGLARALELAQNSRQAESNRLADMRKLFINQLEIQLPKAVINGGLKHQAGHIIHATFPGIDNERLMIQLDEAGVQAAVGSACSAANEEPSHVLKAIGMSDEAARSSLRFSFGKTTTDEDITKTVTLLARFASKKL